METIYKTPTEAAKGIRAELKVTFPGVKFSVKTSYFSMGNSIDISWSFGPTTKAVDAITSKYCYGRFDGMTDSSSTEDTLVSCPDGEVRRLGGAKYVHTTRNFQTKEGGWASETAFCEKVQREICALQNVEYVGEQTDIYSGRKDGNYHHTAQSVARGVLADSDLTHGYTRIVRKDGAFQMAAAPVALVAELPAPVAAAVASVEVSEAYIAAAEEIIAYMGHAAFTMRAEARAEAIRHRAYVRFASLDRDFLFSVVMAHLLTKVAA